MPAPSIVRQHAPKDADFSDGALAKMFPLPEEGFSWEEAYESEKFLGHFFTDEDIRATHKIDGLILKKNLDGLTEATQEIFGHTKLTDTDREKLPLATSFPMISAASRQNLPAMILLESFGYSIQGVQLMNETRRTPFMESTMKSHVAGMRFLAERGATVKLGDIGYAPAWIVAKETSAEMRTLFLGARPKK